MNMAWWRRRARTVRLAACLLACLASGMPGLAGPPPWPDAPYTYYADNQPLREVLAEFAASFSLTLDVAPHVGGVVNGRFNARNPTEFISRLGGVYGFAWYTHGGVLHVSRAGDSIIRGIPMPVGGMANVRQALSELGVLDPRFGWGELPQQRQIMVSGPPGYVAMIEATLRQLPGDTSTQQIRVYRLRHASSEDRSIVWRDRSVVQPGLATVLRSVIGGRASVGSPGVFPVDPAQPLQPPLRPAPLLGSEGAATAATGSAAPPATAGTPSARDAATSAPSASAVVPTDSMALLADRRHPVPSIQSDPRLNALIIQDQPERFPLYEQLIAQLDVPSALIEIEAMIIDVNSERARELGINWSLETGSTSLTFGSPGSFSGPGTISLSQSGGGATTVLAGSAARLLTQIRALENVGDARVQSRPSVLTTDNIGALLDLSESFYVRVQGERVANVSPITAGTTLRVTPRLVDEGSGKSIQLTIDIEDGQIQERQIDALPTVRRATVSTQAVVRMDETLVIAGHAADQNVETLQKVPGLGDLPGVGVLFSNRVRSIQKRERLFMIKPRLVGLPASAE